MTSQLSFQRAAYLVCKWSLSIALLIPMTNWAQSVWVARKGDKTIYLVPTTHVVAFEAKWRDAELDEAIRHTDVAYIENTGIRFDANDYSGYVVPEYDRLSAKARGKLDNLCSRVQEEPNCYKTWHPYFAFLFVTVSALGDGAKPYEAGFEYHVTNRLREHGVGMRSLEYPDEMFAAGSKSSNLAIIESINLQAEASAGDHKNGLAWNTRVLLEGDAMAMKQDTLAWEKNYFSGDFFDHLIIDRTRNMAARMLDDPHKSILVLSGYAHFFSRKDNFFSLLEDQGFSITQLKSE